MYSSFAMLDIVPTEERVTVEVHDLYSKTVDKTSPMAKLLKKPIEAIFGTQPSDKKKVQEIRRVNFSCKPGEIMLVISPADSNVSRLLSIIANRAPSTLEYDGAVLYNSSASSREKDIVAAVLEEDELDPHLSVHDTLNFAAELRLGKLNANKTEEMIKLFGLEDVRYSSVGADQEGIGSHARKRVRLAQELLTSPPVVVAYGMLDDAEPKQAGELMTIFRKLADNGHTVVLGTDEGMAQDLFEEVDTVLLLSKGQVMYFGEANKAEEWFAAQGHSLPEATSLPDFMVNLSDGAVAEDPEDGETARQDSLEVATLYLQEHPEGYKGGDVLNGITGQDENDNLNVQPAAAPVTVS